MGALSGRTKRQCHGQASPKRGGVGKGQGGEKKGLGRGGVGGNRCHRGYGSRKETEEERERERKRKGKNGRVKIDGRRKVSGK